MIPALLLALQVAAATPSVLSVRSNTAEAVVPLIITNVGSAFRPDLLSPVFPVSVRQIATGRYAVSLAGVELEIVDQAPYARVRDAIIPLAGAPFMSGGYLFLPLQIVSELLPRTIPSVVTYSASRSELRFASSTGTAPARRASSTPPAPPGRVFPVAGRQRRVVVDAGHGGPDNGMSGPIGGRMKVHEKDIALAVARQLEAELRGKNVDVVMTRTKDTLVALSDRGRIANLQQGHLFISIHVNAANMRWRNPANARGFETYFLAEAKTEDAKRVEQMENEVVRFETGVNAPKHDPLSFIMNDMAQNEHLRESSDLAAAIQRRLVAVHPGPDRGVKQAGFRVLVTAFMPAVLVEIGFGTNSDEARYLTVPARQREIAGAIAEAALEYLDDYERRVGAASR